MNYKPLILDMTWSHNRISSFYDCRYGWYLNYIADTEKGDGGFFAKYGTLVHKLIEDYYRGNISREALPLKFVSKFYSDVYSPDDVNAAKLSESYLQSGTKYFDEFNGLPFDMIDVEKECEFNINGNKFKGIIDFIGRDHDGSIVVVDHKSRSLKKRSGRKVPTKNDEELDEYLKQLYLYSVYIKSEYGEYPSKLCLNCFRSGILIVEDFDEKRLVEICNEVTKQIKEISEETDFLPTIEYFRCNNLCDFKDGCVYYQTTKGCA